MTRQVAPDTGTAGTAGVRVRSRRLALGLSQIDLADRSGLRATDVGRVERGEQRPGPEALAALARGLGVDPAELAGGPRP